MTKTKTSRRQATKVVAPARASASSPDKRGARATDARTFTRPHGSHETSDDVDQLDTVVPWNVVESRPMPALANGTSHQPYSLERQSALFASALAKPGESPQKRPKPPPRWKEAGEALSRILRERGIGRTQFGEMVGRRYVIVNRWCNGYGFDLDNQRIAAAAIGVPVAEFGEPPVAPPTARDLLREFRASRPIASYLTPKHWSALEFITITIGSSVSMRLLEVLSFAFLGVEMSPDQILGASSLRGELEGLSHKSTPKRRPKK